MKWENKHLLGGNRRPGDVYFCVRGQPHAIDVRVVNGSMPSKITCTLNDRNSHILGAEQMKLDCYQYDCVQNGVLFDPFALDALGRLGPSAKSIISKLPNAIDDTKGARILFRQYWTKRIRAAVQTYHLKRLLANQECFSPSYLAHKTKQDMKRFDDHLNGLPMRPFRNAKRRVAYVAA